MLTLLTTLLCWGIPSPHPARAEPTAVAATTVGDDKPLKALDAWLKLYRAGKLDFRSREDIGKDSLAMKFGLAPKNGLGTPTWAGDLEVILEAVAKLDTPEAAHALLEVAAIGFDQGKAPLSMAPLEVRAAGERWLVKLQASPARAELAKAACGELKVEKSRASATRLAGVRALGQLQDTTFRPVLERLLADADELVRAQAVESLGRFGDDTAAKALVALLERPTETGDPVLAALAETLRTLYGKLAAPAAGASAKAGSPDPKPEDAATPPLPDSVRAAVRASAAALGRASWRADMALVRLLDEFRSPESIPALIGVLERFAAHPDEVKAGKQSGLLQSQAHEALVSMTGAVIPADQPEKWRAFWDSEKSKVAVQPKREKKAAGGTSAATFCGIPVLGTRVVFVLDLSGSMRWPMEEQGTDAKRKQAMRLDFAKRELHNAIDALASNATFNLVTFNGNPKPEVWSKDLVPANERNRDRFRKYVDDLRADGGTNLWSGLDEALKIRSQVQGQRYGANIDELFVLSDGAPNLGDVIDPVEILRVVQETNRLARVRINTIFISSATPAEFRQAEDKASMTPQNLMRKLAEQNGGQFREL